MLNFSNVPLKQKKIAKKVFKEVEKYFNIKGVFSVDITFLEDEKMRCLNNETRNVDRVTDVLSYPSLNLTMPLTADALDDDLFDGKRYSLGSIAICPTVLEAQAKEYGHSNEREMAFLVSHGFLHLLGFDHIEEGMEKEMREHQEKILKSLGFVR